LGFSCKRGFVGLGLVFLSSVGSTSSGFGRPVGKEFLAKNPSGAGRYCGELKCSLAVDDGTREEQDRASGLLSIRLMYFTGSELYCLARVNL
jgi:hypothetical protein